MNSEKLKIFSGFALICLIWGSTWMAIRIGLDSITPILSAGLRFSFASILLFAIMRLKKIRIQKDRRSITLYLISGIFSFVLPFGLVYWGENYIPSWLAAVLFAAMPFFVVLFSFAAFPKEKILSDRIIGMLIGFAGILVIFSKNISGEFSFSLWGMLAVLLSGALQGGIAVMMKKYGEHLNPLSMNFIPVVMAGIMLSLAGLLTEDLSHIRFDSKALISISYLAIFGTIISFTTYYWLLKKMNVVLLSLSSFITPVVAVILGWLFIDEMLTFRDLLGSMMVLIGLLFANFKGLKNYYFSTAK
ncbi:MAG: DMT family transporter [Bacillota bacterium]